MQHTSVSLIPLEANDREQFILDNQRAFWYGAMQEFGMRDDHLDSQGEIISRKTIEACPGFTGQRSLPHYLRRAESRRRDPENRSGHQPQ